MSLKALEFHWKP